MAERVAAMAAHATPERLLRCIEAVLECREALAVNVKPKFAVDAMVATVGQALRLVWAAPSACRRLVLRPVSRARRLSSVGRAISLVMSRSGVRFP